jgi:hypothetical protein
VLRPGSGREHLPGIVIENVVDRRVEWGIEVT